MLQPLDGPEAQPAHGFRGAIQLPRDVGIGLALADMKRQREAVVPGQLPEGRLQLLQKFLSRRSFNGAGAAVGNVDDQAAVSILEGNLCRPGTRALGEQQSQSFLRSLARGPQQRRDVIRLISALGMNLVKTASPRMTSVWILT